MQLTKEKTNIILDSPEKIYYIKIPLIATYALRKKLEEFVRE